MGACSESWAHQNEIPERLYAYPLARITLKDPLQNSIKLLGDGQNLVQEPGIVLVGSVCRILGACSLPRVPTTGQVDQNDPKGPNIIWSRCIA